MTKKICLLTDHHISTNPRLWKEALSLSKEGYDVSIISVFTSTVKRELDYLILKDSDAELIPALNLIPEECARWKRLYYRLRARLAKELKLKLGVDSPFILGYGLSEIKRLADKINADLYIAHIDLCLYVGTRLSIAGKKVAYDIEDWYSNDYLVPERPVKLLQKLERFALENGVYCSCPSLSMAEALSNTYPSGKKPEVLYNGFSQKENADVKPVETNSRSLVWFSQTIGEGRGLETVIHAMSRLTEKVELHLIGECVKGYDEQLKQLFPFDKGHDLIIHPPVKHHELVLLLSNYQIGLAIENNFPGNKNTTVSNKILQYLQAGIKVLATDTKGQTEVAAHFNESVALVPVDDPEKWALQIEQLFLLPAIDRTKQLSRFNELFSWEAQEKKLFQLVRSAVHD
ncbi:MAG: glycosyltransferase [Lacibacter sp.]